VPDSSSASFGQQSVNKDLYFCPYIFTKSLAVKDFKKNHSRFSQNKPLYYLVSLKISQNQELSQITKLNRNKKCQKVSDKFVVFLADTIDFLTGTDSTMMWNFSRVVLWV